MTAPADFEWDATSDVSPGVLCPESPAPLTIRVPVAKKKPTRVQEAKDRATKLQTAYEVLSGVAADIGFIADEARDVVAALTVKKPRAPKMQKKEPAAEVAAEAAAPLPPAAAAVASAPAPPKKASRPSSSAAAGGGGRRPIMAPVVEYYANMKRKRDRETS